MKRILSKVGIIQAIILAVFTAFYSVYMRVVVQLFDVEAIVFTCIALMTSAFIMMLAAGPGRLGRETLLSPATWIYAIFLIGTYLTDVILVGYISATEATFLYNLSVPISLLIAWLWLKRRPDKADWFGLPFVILSAVLVMLIQPAHLFHFILWMGILSAIFDTSHFFLAETHRESNIANEHGNIRDKARVIGFVTFAASLIFMLTTLGFSIAEEQGLLPAAITHLVPPLASFYHPGTIFSALCFGIFVLSILRYCKWNATYNIKTENVVIFLAFVPALTYITEWLLALSPIFAFNSSSFTGERGVVVFIVAILTTIGASIPAISAIKNAKDDHTTIKDAVKLLKSGEDKALASGYQPTAKDDYEAVSATLEQCGGDATLAARLLDVPVGALEAVLAAEGRQAFHPTVAARVARNFRHNVALADPLTGLQNRLNFMNALRPLLKSKKPLALLFIDLNKFKPVNDTYGHEAGDVVLKTIAQRLLLTAPQGSLIARLGGDEFVITLSGNHIKQAPQITQAIIAAISEPILLTSDLPPVELGAAIGKALFPNDAKTAEDLIKHADKQMYKVKRAR